VTVTRRFCRSHIEENTQVSRPLEIQTTCITDRTSASERNHGRSTESSIRETNV
jgi:hypothetical protein